MFMDVSVETYEQYHYALRAGKKNVRRRRRENKNIHPEVLDNIVNVYDCSQERLGQIDVPASLIVGPRLQPAPWLFHPISCRS